MSRLILAILLLVGASVAGWWFLIMEPASAQSAALDAEILQLQTQESQLANQRAQLQSLRERAPELQAAQERLATFIPNGVQQDVFFEQLQLAGDAAGISFTSLGFSSPEVVEGAPTAAIPGAVLGTVTVDMQLTGTYFQLVDFLRRLEVVVPRAVLVETVSMTESGDGFPNVTASVGAQIFSLVRAPVTDAAGNLATPVPPAADSGAAADPGTTPAAADATATPLPAATPEGQAQ